jgi:hypothetical protein
MAHFTTTIQSSKTVEEAFRFMSDLRNFAQWDRNIIKVEQINGDGPGLNTVFDITVRGLGGKPSVLRYTTLEFDEYSNILVRGVNRIFTSVDRVTVSATATGCDVTYDAILTANWIVSPLNLFLGPIFKKVGDSATKGLRKVLA